jgi:hypothetical protein
MTIEYRPEDFTPHGIITEEVVKHVLENVEDFEPRYYLAMKAIDEYKCTLEFANSILWDEIMEAALDCFDFDEWVEIPECFFDDLDSVFG